MWRKSGEQMQKPPYKSTLCKLTVIMCFFPWQWAEMGTKKHHGTAVLETRKPTLSTLQPHHQAPLASTHKLTG